jgi:TrpR-related protein YerC/YecD
MTKLSFKKLSDDKIRELTDQLWKSVTLLETKDEVRLFLCDLLTRTEIQMLAKRLQVVRMLNQGLKYEEIRQALNISEATISKIHNWEDAFGGGYRIVVERLNKLDNHIKKKKNIFIGSKHQAAINVWKGGASAVVKMYKKGKKSHSLNT